MNTIFQTLTTEQRRVMYNALSDRIRLADDKLVTLTKDTPQWRAWYTERQLAKQMRNDMHNYGTIVHGVLIKVKNVAGPTNIPINRGRMN